MNKTVFYITENGRRLAEKLKGLYPDIDIVNYTAKAVQNCWGENKGLIFIMAAGIVVRIIAPLITDKRTDPAVVVLDEKGNYAISLLSGHIGGANTLAADIALFLGGQAVITTASDVNNMPAIDLWARENHLAVEGERLLPLLGTRLLDSGSLKVYSEAPIALPDAFLPTGDPNCADICITNKQRVTGTRDETLYLRPKNLSVGIGCNSGTPASEIERAVAGIFDEHNLSLLSIRALATITIKAGEPGLAAFASRHSLKVVTFTPEALNSIEGIEKSEAVFKATGAYAVAEPAALAASGNGRLIVPKQKRGNVTVSIAQKDESGVNPPLHPSQEGTSRGRIYVVGTGPGSLEHITPYALKALRESEAVVGYGTYLDLITELIKDKEVVSTGMTQEIDRCRKAVDLAYSGKTVAVVSGGDPGIYAMAGLVFEVLKDRHENSSPVMVEVIPGISALNAGASRLGAPLMHDFAVISLSDRLTPWGLIEQRLEAAAMADFVIVLYNPKSMGRPEHIVRAREIVMKYRRAETPVGIVKAAMRVNEHIVVTTLRDMLDYDIDMQTTVIIGNSNTFVWNSLMITPRGYEKKAKRAAVK